MSNMRCVGSWVTYGLRAENQSLPAFVMMSDSLGCGLILVRLQYEE